MSILVASTEAARPLDLTNVREEAAVKDEVHPLLEDLTNVREEAVVKDEVHPLQEGTNYSTGVVTLEYDASDGKSVGEYLVRKGLWASIKGWAQKAFDKLGAFKAKHADWFKAFSIFAGAACLIVTLACPPCAIAAAVVAFSISVLNAICDVAEARHKGEAVGWGGIAFSVGKAAFFAIANIAAPGAGGAMKEFLTVITSATVGILDFLCDTYGAIEGEDAPNEKKGTEKIEPKDAKAKTVDAKKGVLVMNPKDLQGACDKSKLPADKVKAAMSALAKIDTSDAKKYFKCMAVGGGIAALR